MKVFLSYKKSRFELYSNSTNIRVREYALNSEDTPYLKEAHELLKRDLESIVNTLKTEGIKYDMVYRSLQPDLSPYKVAICAGGDGTTINLAMYTKKTPVLGVKAGISQGVLCVATPKTLRYYLKNLDDVEKVPKSVINRLNISFNGIVLPEQIVTEAMFRGVDTDDFKNKLTHDGRKRDIRTGYELIVSSGAGTTGAWYNYGGPVMPYDSKKIFYHIAGNIKTRDEYISTNNLKIISKLREAKLYINGSYKDYDVTLLDEFSIFLGTPFTLVGDLNKQRELKGFI